MQVIVESYPIINTHMSDEYDLFRNMVRYYVYENTPPPRDFALRPSILDLGCKNNPERATFAALVLALFIAPNEIWDYINELTGNGTKQMSRQLSSLMKFTHALLLVACKSDSPYKQDMCELYKLFDEFGAQITVTDDLTCLDNILPVIANICLNENHVSEKVPLIYECAHGVLEFYIERYIYKVDNAMHTEMHLCNVYENYLDFIREWNGLRMVCGHKFGHENDALF